MTVFQVRILGGINPPVLYPTNIVKMIEIQVLLACQNDLLSRRRESSCSNEQGAAYHPVNTKWSDQKFPGMKTKVIECGVRWVLCKYNWTRQQPG